MTRARPWDNEGAGAALIASLLDGRPIPRDIPGAPPGTRDFDVELQGGELIALEITQHADSDILAQRSLEAKKDWTFSELAYHWVVKVREPADVHALHRDVPCVLTAFENNDRDRWLHGKDRLDDESEALLRSLKVRLIYRLNAARPGSISLGAAPAGGVTSPDLLTEVAQDHATRQDNVAKLGEASGVTERHLLVWIHTDLYQLTTAMSLGHAPAALPDLPAAVDVVWLASTVEHSDIWRADRTGWSAWPAP